MLRHRHDIGASHFSNGDTAVGLVCGIEVNVIGSNAGRDCEFELLSFSEPFGGEVTGMEADSKTELAIDCVLEVTVGQHDYHSPGIYSRILPDSRCSDDNLSIDQLLVKLGILAFFIRSSD